MIDAARIGLRLRAAREQRGLSQQAVAGALNIPRTAVTNIETGNRAVSTLELAKLAELYRQNAARFIEENHSEDDLSLALPRALQEGASGPGFQAAIDGIIDLCREGVSLRHRLDRDFELNLPDYAAKIATAGEAIRHAEIVALEERRRLGLGNSPASNIAELISSQGIWVAASDDLPEGVSGLFVNHVSVGIAIVVNAAHAEVRRRFSYAHEYAHALFDRVEAVRFTQRVNAGELIEKRANAFAAAFLLPASGVSERLRRMDKGRPSRQSQIVYDVANDIAAEAEIRPRARSQAITFQDAGAIARHFGVSYESAVWRLKSLGYLGLAETESLIAQKDDSRRLARILKIRVAEEAPPPDDREQELPGQLARLAIEAYRRGEISQGRLRELASKLGIVAGDLIDLAEAARAT